MCCTKFMVLTGSMLLPTWHHCLNRGCSSDLEVYLEELTWQYLILHSRDKHTHCLRVPQSAADCHTPSLVLWKTSLGKFSTWFSLCGTGQARAAAAQQLTVQKNQPAYCCTPAKTTRTHPYAAGLALSLPGDKLQRRRLGWRGHRSQRENKRIIFV